MSLASATLLPQATQSSRAHPPIYVRLTPAVLTTIRSGKQPMSVEFEGPQARLVLGKTNHAGALTAEPGNLEVYVALAGGSKTAMDELKFRSIGRVTQRLVLRTKRDTTTEPATAAAAFAASAPVSSSISALNSSSASTRRSIPGGRRRAAPAARNSSTSSQGSSPGDIASPSEQTNGTANSHSHSLSSSSSPLSSSSLSSSSSSSASSTPTSLTPSSLLSPLSESTPSPEILSRVVHTLAPGCKTPTALAKILEIPLETALAAVQACASPADARGIDEPYVLRDRAYCDLRVWEWPYSDDERNAAIERAGKAYGRLGLPSDHSARLRLLKPKPRRVPTAASRVTDGPTAAKQQAASSVLTPTPAAGPVARKSARTPSRTSPRSPEGASTPEPDARSATAITSATFARATSPAEEAGSTTVTTVTDSDGPRSREDLQRIARRFRETYPEYQKLYALLSARRSRPPAQVRRLLSLHRDLENWKRRLWSNADTLRLPAGS